MQGCQFFTAKPAQLLLKTSSIAFKGGSPGKNRDPGGKIHDFWQGSPGKIRTPGDKYHVIVLRIAALISYFSHLERVQHWRFLSNICKLHKF